MCVAGIAGALTVSAYNLQETELPMQATQDAQAVSEALFGRRFIAYCQAHPDAATGMIDVLFGRGDPMGRSLAQTIRQSVVEAEKCT